MSYEPCLNPNCKSYGHPHPNCRCYGSFAEGGEVEHFCKSNGAHKKDCEYYSDGGSVSNGKEPMQHTNALHSVAAYLAHKGFNGALKMGPEHTIEAYDRDVHHGKKRVKNHIDYLFEGKRDKPQDHSKSKKEIREWMAKGGVLEHIYNEAEKEGKGIHHDHPIAQVYPDQNVILQSVKGRVSSYLGSLKPQEPLPQLGFDIPREDVQGKKRYERALDIAAHPLSVLHKINDGTLNREDVMNLKQMYPEIDDKLQKRITEKLVQNKLNKGKDPPYRVKQALNMYLGGGLLESHRPANIMAAQATFQTQKQRTQQPEQADKPVKKTSALSKADDSYLTGNQARVARSQKQ